MTEERPKRGAMGYYQFASVVLLLTMVGFSISGLWGLLRIIIPDLTFSGYEWKRISTLDRYLEAEYKQENGRYYRMASFETKSDTAKTGGLSREQVEEKWKKAKADTLYEERRGGLQQILFWFVAVAVCLPLYLYHHKAVKKARQQMEQPAGQ
jgi:hypothetical protein